MSRAKTHPKFRYGHKGKPIASIECSEKIMGEILEAFNQWEEASFQYHAVEEDGRTVRLYSVCTRTLEMFSTLVTYQQLCDRLNAPQEEKNHIDFGMNRKYFPSLEATMDFIASKKEWVPVKRPSGPYLKVYNHMLCTPNFYF